MDRIKDYFEISLVWKAIEKKPVILVKERWCFKNMKLIDACFNARKSSMHARKIL